MTLPRMYVENGTIKINGERIVPFGPVYFARRPGTCGGEYFADEWWEDTREYLERDFARMAEIGCNLVVPFVKTTHFYHKGEPVEKMFGRFDQMLKIAEKNGIYVYPLPNAGIAAYENVMGKPYVENPDHPHKHMSLDPQMRDFHIKQMTTLAERYANETAFFAILNGAGGGRLWTGYAGYAPDQPDGKPLLTAKKPWQQWLREKYKDDFDAFLESHPKLPENPKSFDEVALPVEVEGQFTEADSRTFDFLAFSAHASARAQNEICKAVHAEVPNILLSGCFEGCEFERGPMEVYVPGISDIDLVWLEAYQFNMTHGSHTHPDWERKYFFEPITNKLSVDMLSTITEAWERARYLKAAMPETAVVLGHGTVLDNLIRWTPDPIDQRIIFERMHRTYMDAGIDGIGFWCWTDDETSSRPEPEYFYREGEAMGFIDYHENWRPMARRAAAYAKAATPTARVSEDVVLLLPTPHMMGLDRVDGLTTAACLTSALARAGIAPDVKATYSRGQEGIPLDELLQYKMIVLGADEYRKDFPSVPGVLRQYVEQGGRLLMAMAQPDTLLSPTLQALESADLAALTGNPKVLNTNHQHDTKWTASVRWQLRDDFLPYWDNRRGRWLPGRGEKRLMFKWIELPEGAEVLAEAVVPQPAADRAYGTQDFHHVGENVWYPIFYRRPLGKGAVYVMPYTFNVYRSYLDQIDVQRDDWDWMLQAVIDDAGVRTDPCHSLSVLAQEFINFRPTR